MSDQRRSRSGALPFVGVMVVLLAGIIATLVRTAMSDPTAPLEALLAAGAKDDARVAAGEVHRLFLAGLVHVNATHALVNGLGLLLGAGLLWRIAPPDARDRSRALALIALAILTTGSGFGASFVARNGLSCGASAAVFGYLGAAAGAVWMTEALTSRRRIALALAAFGLASALAFLPKAGIDHAAHLGGWASGVVAGCGLASHRGHLALVVVALFALGLTAL